VNYYCKL